MPKFGGFLGFNTGLKVCAGAAVGYLGTVAVQHYRTSEPSDNEPPEVQEERNERQKKFEFEVQQRSNELTRREQAVKASEEALAKQKAELKEQLSALQYMQAKNNAPSESETVAAEAVQKEVLQVVGSENVKIVNPDPVVPPNDYVPRRPQVFDGHGNAPVVPKASVTNEPRLLYFHDPSFATDDGRYDPAIPRRDTSPHLADMFKRRRFMNLKPQHVASLKIHKDGWSLETQDGVSNGAYAPATEIEHVIDSTASGALRKSEKGDTTVVTLHGRGPKPPSDGKGAVSEAERSAFNEQKRLLAEQKEAFEREKSKKEKELADKEKDLEVRKKFLDLREENKDDAADLFDLEEPRVVMRRTEDFHIPRQEKAPYELKKQNEGGMTIEAKSKEPNIVQSHSAFDIEGRKQPFENLELERGGLFVPRREKKSLEIIHELDLQVFPKDKPKKELSFQNIEAVTLKASEKTSPEIKSNESFEIAGKKQPFENLEKEKVELFVSGKEKEPPSLSIEDGETLTVLPKEKALYVMEKQNGKGMTIKRQPKQQNKKQNIDNLQVDGDKWQAEHAGSYKVSYEGDLAIIPYGRHPGDKSKVDASSESTQTDFKPKKTKTKEQGTSTDEPLLSISEAGDVVTFEGKKSFGELEKAFDFVHIPAKPKETSSVIAKTGQVFLKAKKIKTKEEETAVGSQTVDFKGITENNFSVPGQEKAPLQTSGAEAMTFSALWKPDNEVSPLDTIEFAGEEPKKTENIISSDKGFEIQAKPIAKAVNPNLISQHSDFSLPAEKKVKKRDSATGMEAPTPSVMSNEVSFEYQTKTEPKLLSAQSTNEVSLTGKKSFGELEENVVAESMYIPAKPKPANEIDSVEKFDILRQAKPENKINSEVSVEMLSKPKEKPVYAETNHDRFSIKGNDANWYLQKELVATKEKLETEKVTSQLLKEELELTKVLHQAGKATKLDALKQERAVSESVLRTKNTSNAEVQTTGKVPLFTEKNELFIKREKPSEDLDVDDLDVDDLDVDDLDVDDFDVDDFDVDDFSKIPEDEKREMLRKRQHGAMVDSVRIWVKSYISDKKNTESVVSKILEGNEPETKEVKEKLEKTEEKFLRGNDEVAIEEVRGIIAQYMSAQNDKPPANKPKASGANKTSKPGWSVLAVHSNVAGDTFEGKMQPKVSRKFVPRKAPRICFIGKSPFTVDAGIQSDGSRRFLGNLQSENVMEGSFVDDKLSLVSRLERKKQKHKKLKSDYEELQKDAKDMLEINDEYVDENKKLKTVNEEQAREMEALEKRYENLLEAFEKQKELAETGCGLFETAARIVLNDAKAIALEAMKGIADGTLRGEKAEKLIRRFDKTARGWYSISLHKCDDSVCRERQIFMDSLACLLQSRLRKTDAFKVIQAGQYMLKGSAPKTPKPFEVILADSFGLKVDQKIKSEKEAQKEQLSKLKAENEYLKSELEEKSGKEEALLDIMKNCAVEDTEENKALKRKLEELEKQNEEKKEKIEELEKYDRQSIEVLQAACSDNAELQKKLEEKNKEITKYRMLLKEVERIQQEKDKENKALKERPKNEGDEKKNGKDKKFKKPTDPETEKEVDGFRERLKRAGDNLSKLGLLQNELKNKPYLKKWVSDELEEAIKNAKERKEQEEKRKKEAEEAEADTKELMKAIESAKDSESIRNVIAKLLKNAERRLNFAAEDFKKGTDFQNNTKNMKFRIDSLNIKRNVENSKEIDESLKKQDKDDLKKVSEKFVKTVSSLHEYITNAWKKMVDVLRPEGLPPKMLDKCMENEVQRKVNEELKKKAGKASEMTKEEKEAMIAPEVEKQVEQRLKEIKLQSLNTSIKKKHMPKMKTEANLLPLYNFTDTDVWVEERDNGRRSIPYETPLISNKSRSRCGPNRNSYSIDKSRQRTFTHSKTLLKGLENFDLRREEYDKEYNESQIKPDNTFEDWDTKGRISFSGQGRGSNFLGSIEETADETNGNTLEPEWSELQETGRQWMDNLTEYLLKKENMRELTWNKDLMDQVTAWKKQTEEIFSNIGKNSRMSVVEPQIDKKIVKLPSTPKVIKKIKIESRLIKTEIRQKTEKKRGGLKKNLEGKFSNEQSGVKTEDKTSYFIKINNRKGTKNATKRK